MIISGPSKYFLNGWNYMDISIICLIVSAEIIRSQTVGKPTVLPAGDIDV